MDATKFGPNSAGRLVQIDTPRGKDWAFIPNALPSTWEFDPALWPLLAEAKEALGTLNGIGQTLPDPQLLLRPLQNREAITSSNIEGTYVTPEQLLLFELNPTEPSKPNDRSEDWLEVFNYNRALEHGRELLKTIPVCNRLIKEMHQVLLRGARGGKKAPGEFRNAQVQIGSSARFMPPPANEVVPLMDNLEKYINSPDERIDPLVRCFIVHYQFETIHPFRDGNGRIGRSLLSLMVSHWHGHTMPWLYMSPFYEKFKEEYIDGLYRVSTEGAWSKWIEFCLRGTIEQSKDSVRRCHEFNRLRKEFYTRINQPTSRTRDLVESLFTSPVLTIPSVASRTNVTYATARTDVEILVKANILAVIPDHHPKTFYCNELMKVAYREEDEKVNLATSSTVELESPY